MKTIPTITLSLTAAAQVFAAPAAGPESAIEKRQTSTVFFATDTNYGGQTTTLQVTIDPPTCLSLPSNFDNQVSSFRPGPGIYCFLYDLGNCQLNPDRPDSGRTWAIDIDVPDLSQADYNFDNVASGVQCGLVNAK